MSKKRQERAEASGSHEVDLSDEIDFSREIDISQELKLDKESRKDDTSLTSIIIQTLVVLVLMGVLVVLAGMYLREPLQDMANWVVDTFGVWGIFVGIAIADSLTFPVPPDTYIFIGVASEMPALKLIIACCAGSIIAGNLSYKLGPHLARVAFLRKRIEKFRPRGEKLFKRYGIWAMAIAALSPFPYSLTCWLAGLYNMEYRPFFLSTLLRIPRMTGYYFLFLYGWA